ncbi:MAG: O-antigen ligase family protein [Phycisphaerae bacterium]
MAKVFIFVLLLTRVVADLRSYRLVVLLLVAGALYFGWQCKTAPASSFYGGRLNGIGGPDFREASGLGLHLAVMLPLVGSFFLQPSWPCKAFAFLAGAFACNGIILTQTRSAFIGLMAGLTAALLWARQALRKRVLLGVCLALAGGLILTDQSFWTRMQTILQARKDISADTRLAIWRSSLSIWADHPLGVGVGNFERVIGHYNPDLAHKDAHSILVECYGELGILGLAIFLLVVRAAFSELRLAESSASRSTPVRPSTSTSSASGSLWSSTSSAA